MTYYIGVRIDDTDTFQRSDLPVGHPERGDLYGHALLTLTDDAGNSRVWDMNPFRTKWPSIDPTTGEVSLAPVIGRVGEDSGHPWDFEKRIPIAQGQYDAALSYAETMAARPLLYHAFPFTQPTVETYSCLSFVVNAFSAASVSIPGFLGLVSPATVPRLDFGLAAITALNGIFTSAADVNSVDTIIYAFSDSSGEVWGTGKTTDRNEVEHSGSDLIVNFGAGDITADEGNDIVYNGLLGGTVHGGKGEDRLEGGFGKDVLFGEEDDDTLKGGMDSDQLIGGAGADTLNGGADDDELWGDLKDPANTDIAYADTLNGDAGDDILHGGGGTDTLNGGADNDFLYGDAGDDRLDGGDGKDTLYGADGNDTLEGGAGKDLLLGGKDDDTLKGGDDEDELQGNTGNDTGRMSKSRRWRHGDRSDIRYVANDSAFRVGRMG